MFPLTPSTKHEEINRGRMQGGGFQGLRGESEKLWFKGPRILV